MLAGTAWEARWSHQEPRRSLAPEVLDRIVRAAFPARRTVHVEALASGLRNANFKLVLDGPPGVAVLRLYEHDPSLCRKEVDLFGLVRQAVPVPEVFHVNPDESEELPPFTLARFVDGLTFHQLKKTGDREAIAQAACSAGETLAAIGRIRFDKPGWLGPGPAVSAPLPGAGCPLPQFVDLCLTDPCLQQRVPPEWRSRVHDLLWLWEPELAALSQDPRLVHGDFNRRNLLVQPVKGRWQVAAVLDWEFAFSGSPLADVGTFLRYEKPLAPLAEPHFSDGYCAAGGQLPKNWRSLARCLSLAAICESLTHDDLPPAIALELVDLLMQHCL